MTHPNHPTSNLPQSCILIHTDGACSGNPGPGGWAAIIERFVDGEAVMRKTLTDGDNDTTNVRMEMAAAIGALRSLTATKDVPIIIRTDSQLVVKGMNEWLPGWIANRWRTADRKPVKNQDLWRELHALSKDRNVSFRWVRSHDGDDANEEADRLAAKEAQRRKAALLAS